jgi:two-component system LytT family sensor kinase
MNEINIASLINLLGYTLGIALYAMLLVMVLKHPAQSIGTLEFAPLSLRTSLSSNGLLPLTAVLGLLWNIGALTMYGLKGLGYVASHPIVSAISFTALGFLPAVVVHSVLRGRKANNQVSRLIKITAYCLSAAAGAFHFYEAINAGVSPSLWSLRLLTFGYVALLAVLFLSTRKQEGGHKAVWASALAVFAVSALHLGHHSGANTDSWFVELTGHHASLPLVLAILYEDYRFAFADIFLKRALALLVLVALAFGLYIGVASPLLKQTSQGQFDPRSVGTLLSLWVITALVYPWLHRGVVRFVDSIVLRRVDYGKLRADVAQMLTKFETPEEIMDQVSKVLALAVSAREIRWSDVTDNGSAPAVIPRNDNGAQLDHETSPDESVTILEGSRNKGAIVIIPTAEPPYYKFEIGVLAGGRRLLSDDIGMLEAVAVMVARRIDALRVTHERCEQSLREQEINKLATEAQLRALRAQVNPHFLFNALTTIGYLVQTAPDRALETLMKLTSLLRGVLRTDEEFVTLEQELQLIASYLDIERARFEERLRFVIDIPKELLPVRIPSLLVQPLVENAIKHGITPSRFGGEVRIEARIERTSEDADHYMDVLDITVSDSGIGASEIELARGRRRGLGLNNIEERLRCYGGQSASLRIDSVLGEGTVVALRLPLSNGIPERSAGTLMSVREKQKA